MHSVSAKCKPSTLFLNNYIESIRALVLHLRGINKIAYSYKHHQTGVCNLFVFTILQWLFCDDIFTAHKFYSSLSSPEMRYRMTTKNITHEANCSNGEKSLKTRRQVFRSLQFSTGNVWNGYRYLDIYKYIYLHSELTLLALVQITLINCRGSR